MSEQSIQGSTGQSESSRQPYLLVGAGPLSATVWKQGTELVTATYAFNISRTSRRTGRVTQRFRPQDLPAFVRLVRVLAAALADDGCLPPDLRHNLGSLAGALDGVARLGRSRCHKGRREQTPGRKPHP